jgi:sporulation integral membrane protein YlbJ
MILYAAPFNCIPQLYICVVISINSPQALTGPAGRRPMIFIVFLFCAACVLYLTAFPSDAAGAVAGALRVCGSTVIPSLFPFIVVNTLLVDTGFAFFTARFIGRPVSALFAVSGAGSAAFLLGALSGFPLGAECAARLYERGQCTKDDAERLIAFCNNTGPAFLVGGIGAGMWNRPEIGWLIYLSQLLSAVIVGIALRFTRTGPIVPRQRRENTGAQLSASVFTSAVSGASVSMLKICGFITAFSVLCAMVRRGALLSGYPLGGRTAALLFGFLEITAGSGAASQMGGNAGIALTAAAAGWSGLSVHMQTASVIAGKGLSMKRYIAGKAAQGVLCVLIAYAGAVLLNF